MKLAEFNSEVGFKEIKKSGIVKVKKFLTDIELTNIKKILTLYKFPKNHPKSYYSINKKLLAYKLIKLNFVMFKNHLAVFNLNKKKKMNFISDKIFNKKSYLKFIDGYHTPVGEQDVLPWHTDQAYKGDEKNIKGFVNPDHAHLKFFIYLTDVGSNNGCMSYIPGSHKIGYALRKGFFEKKIKYTPYFLLEDFRRTIKKEENKRYINTYLQDSNLVEEFLEKTDFIEQKKESQEFDYNLSAGDAIIFDEGGLHKGSKSLYSERLVLRYLYSIKK